MTPWKIKGNNGYVIINLDTVRSIFHSGKIVYYTMQSIIYEEEFCREEEAAKRLKDVYSYLTGERNE